MCEKAQADGECFMNWEVDASGIRRDANCENYCKNLESVMRTDECKEDLEELVDCMDEAENACHALRDSCELEHDGVEGCTGYCEDGEGEDRADCKVVWKVRMTGEPPR